MNYTSFYKFSKDKVDFCVFSVLFRNFRAEISSFKNGTFQEIIIMQHNNLQNQATCLLRKYREVVQL